jgi:predicted unusual protein kinase regulating ubiquinone biosynthesis (AarF/ABC1/UbiB family)
VPILLPETARLYLQRDGQRSERQLILRELLRVFGDMKGLPLKLGQMLSYIDEFIPPEHRHVYEETLGRLQMHTPTMEFEHLAHLFVEDLGAPPVTLFARFDPEPIAAASIGQVYRATLHDGREVVVKVQYPGVVDALRSDLANIGSLISAMSMVMPGDFKSLVEDFAHTLLDECDYEAEARSQEAFRAAWGADPDVVVPAVVAEHSSGRILTSTYIPGKEWSVVLAEGTAAEKAAWGRTIFRFVFGSLFDHGMFNGDPHPGNYIFLDGGRVAFIDYGCVSRYTPDQQAAFSSLRLAVLRDARGEEFRRLARQALTMPEDLDPEMMDAVAAYLHLVFEPVTRPQPYTWTREYSTELLRHTMALKQQMTVKLLRHGKRAYPLDLENADSSVAFLGRIVFGLGSILATLGAEGDFHALVAGMGDDDT